MTTGSFGFRDDRKKYAAVSRVRRKRSDGRREIPKNTASCLRRTRIVSGCGEVCVWGGGSSSDLLLYASDILRPRALSSSRPHRPVPRPFRHLPIHRPRNNAASSSSFCQIARTDNIIIVRVTSQYRRNKPNGVRETRFAFSLFLS